MPLVHRMWPILRGGFRFPGFVAYLKAGGSAGLLQFNTYQTCGFYVNILLFSFKMFFLFLSPSHSTPLRLSN